MISLLKFLDNPLKVFGRVLPQARWLAEEKLVVKRPPNAFGKYVQDQSENIQKNNPHLRFGDLMKLASISWKNETYATQQRYKENFVQEMAIYKQNLPNIPKAPPKPFAMFLKENYDYLRNHHNDHRKRLKSGSEMWHNLSDAERQKYAILYSEKLDQYKQSLTDDDKEVMKERKNIALKKKERKDIKMYGKDALSRRPVSPFRSVFHLFLRENSAERPEGQNLLKFIGQKWNNLSAHQRSIYEERFQNAMSLHEKELEKWKQSSS